MNFKETVAKAKEQLSEFTTAKVEGVIGASKTEEGWVVMVEVLERKGLPDIMDIIGEYEVVMDNKGNLINYERRRLRKRGDTKMEER